MSLEQSFDSDYASGYAIESVNENGIHGLPKAMPMSVKADLHNLHYPLDYVACT
jgi:hypothetical protein